MKKKQPKILLIIIFSGHYNTARLPGDYRLGINVDCLKNWARQNLKFFKKSIKRFKNYLLIC